LPEIVTTVPPLLGPEAGWTAATTGGALVNNQAAPMLLSSNGPLTRTVGVGPPEMAALAPNMALPVSSLAVSSPLLRQDAATRTVPSGRPSALSTSSPGPHSKAHLATSLHVGDRVLVTSRLELSEVLGEQAIS
jgi:hypothetical protein